jgi:amidase
VVDRSRRGRHSSRPQGNPVELMDPKIAELHRRIVKTTADGKLVEFASVVDALHGATEVQAGRVEAQCRRSEQARPPAMPTGRPSGSRRPVALLLNIMLAAALLCGANRAPDVRAQMHTQSLALIEATIPQLQSALTAGIVTSHDLITLYLARIDAYDQHGPALNAISITNGKALAEADSRDAERRAGAHRGPMHGVPIIVKDNYDTADLQTAAGSRSLAGWVPPDDAFLVTKLREAGAIIIAKSNMHEFAYGITTLGSLFGQTRNPYALDRNPGGSSGGTGAAIAANFAAAGMGSDTCGSIRIPASHNSLVGIRGTQGLASRSGIIPLSSTQDIGGPIARKPMSRSCSTRSSAMIPPTRRLLRASAIRQRATPISCNSPDCAAPASVCSQRCSARTRRTLRWPRSCAGRSTR